MSDVRDKKDQQERRASPRTKAQCPVHYFSQHSGNWVEAVLKDYSAGGVCFYCDDTLLQDTKISIQIRRDKSISLPAIAASAVVVRCDVDEKHRFKIACKFTQNINESASKYDYLRR